MARLTANILKATSGDNEAVENDVLTVGTRLFTALDGAAWLLAGHRG